ncbi:hypothetical protein KKI24_09395 [bacterium]|nr:hypothetical protein [bacterium]
MDTGSGSRDSFFTDLKYYPDFLCLPLIKRSNQIDKLFSVIIKLDISPPAMEVDCRGNQFWQKGNTDAD